MPELSEAAQSLRTSTRTILALALLTMVLSFAGARGWVPRQLSAAALYLSMACLISALWLGVKGRQQRLADREREARLTMIITIASQLKAQDDATLQTIAKKGGPAGEAAEMLLRGRRERARPTGGSAGEGAAG
jgi:hypothetical protein